MSLIRRRALGVTDGLVGQQFEINERGACGVADILARQHFKIKKPGACRVTDGLARKQHGRRQHISFLRSAGEIQRSWVPVKSGGDGGRRSWTACIGELRLSLLEKGIDDTRRSKTMGVLIDVT